MTGGWIKSHIRLPIKNGQYRVACVYGNDESYYEADANYFTHDKRFANPVTGANMTSDVIAWFEVPPFTMDDAHQIRPIELVQRDAEIAELTARADHLESALETERIRLAACSTAALGHFTDCKDEYWSASLSDVLELRAKHDKLREALFLADNALATACSNSPWEDACPCGGNRSLKEANDEAKRKCPILHARHSACVALNPIVSTDAAKEGSEQ